MTERDFANATKALNRATGTRYERLPGTDLWSASGRPEIAGCVTTAQMEALPEMEPVAEQEG